MNSCFSICVFHEFQLGLVVGKFLGIFHFGILWLGSEEVNYILIFLKKTKKKKIKNKIKKNPSKKIRKKP